MENLSSLVNNLSSGEKKLVTHFYKLNTHSEYRKRMELFQLVAKNKFRSEEDAAQQLGYGTVSTSFYNLKSRLKADIYCILLMQDSTSKFSTPYAQAAFNCRRALLTGEILLSRGVYDEGISLLRKAARVAARFELYAERIIAEDALRNHHAGANDESELDQGTETIERSYHLLGNIMKSKKKLYETVFSDHKQADNDPESSGYTSQLIAELDALENESGSSRVKFYSQLSKLNIFNTAGKLDQALQCAKGLLDAVEKDPVVMSKSNQAGIELEISNMYLRSFEYARAHEHAERAASLFKPGMINHLRALTIMFYADVHCGKYDQARVTMQTLMNSRCLKDSKHELLYNRLLLLKAWFNFVSGETVTAVQDMKYCTALIKEKGPWFFGYAILECMIMIEKGKHESALYKLDALRKTITRQLSEAYLSRVVAIIGVLRSLIRFNNDHAAVIESGPRDLQSLHEGARGCAWDPSGFELVRVDAWLKMKAGMKNV